MLAISLDGRLAFPPSGGGTLGGEEDRKVLEEALAWSDATLMGSGTLEKHQNTCLIKNSKLIKKRLEEGRSPQPLSIIVSKKVCFSRKLEFFQQPIKRWLLSPFSNSEMISKKGFDNHLKMKNNWFDCLIDLGNKGFTKITLLGGAKLITSLLLEDQVDELQLTLTPRILGGEYTWISSDVNNLPINLSKFNSWTLNNLEAIGNNQIMVNYIRNRN